MCPNAFTMKSLPVSGIVYTEDEQLLEILSQLTGMKTHGGLLMGAVSRGL